MIRKMKSIERGELEKFLYEAIYIPEGTSPPRTIINRPELKVYVEDFGTRAADVCFVAEVGGEIVGACWSRIMNDYGHIDDETPSLALSVLKNFRRRGIASDLMKKLCTRLAEKNFKRVSLAVQKENSAAVRLYRKLGFEIVDERGTELLMMKRLGDD
ncbi:MAG: GNAT family N-acetyltransferase [Selenomonadaceae bacterium]|nr:GNAT family N-acetyltransferase [Selenomonadaceae bacterium]